MASTSTSVQIIDHPLWSTLLLILVVTLFSFPSYDVALVLHEMDDNWNALFLQASEPFIDHTNRYDAGSHMAKLSFRFVPALLMRVLGVDTIAAAVVLQFALMALFHTLLLLVFRVYLRAPRNALLYALPICFVVSGHVYASDYRGIFDTLALVFLLGALLLRGRALMILFLLLAYFTDERSIIASSSIFLIAFLEHNTSSFQSIVRVILGKEGQLILASWIAYWIIRVSLASYFGLTVTSVDVTYYLMDNLPRLPYTVFIGMEGLLVLLFAKVISTWHARQWFFTLLIFLNYLAFLVVAMSVVDINRSFAYALLLQIFLLLSLERVNAPNTKWPLLAWTILLSIPYGDFLPLPAQIYRMVFVTGTL